MQVIKKDKEIQIVQVYRVVGKHSLAIITTFDLHAPRKQKCSYVSYLRLTNNKTHIWIMIYNNNS